MPCDIERPELTPRERRDYHRLIRLLAERLVMRNRARKALAQGREQEHKVLQVEVLDVQGQDHEPTQAEVLDNRRTKRPSKQRAERPAINAARRTPDPLTEWIAPSISTNPTSASKQTRKEF